MDNALNVTKKEILTRFDFKDSKTEITFDKKANLLSILTENDMRLESAIDILRSRMIKQNLDPRCLDEGKERFASGNMLKKELKVKQGVDKETSKKIIADIKASKIKVSAQLMDDLIRVSGKKIDDLQAVIQLVRRGDYGIPLQYINMK